MTNAHSFPLLRLPCLAREHVILVMDVREQYLFSTLSNKCKRIAKNGVRKHPYFFYLEILPSATHVNIGEGCLSKRFTINILPIEEKEEASDRSLDVINLNVEDVREQSIELLIFLKDVFKFKPTSVLECKFIPNDFVKEFLAIVRHLKIEIDELEVRTEYDNNQNEMFEWVMQNCRDVKKLKNCCSTTPDFEWHTEQPFSFERCFLLTSPFLTLGHVTRLFWDCIVFEAMDICDKMTNQDLNQLVKLWMNGSSKLEHVEISMNDSFNIEKVMRDIIKKVPVESARIANSLIGFELGDAFKIKDQNGKEAVVCHAYENLFVITTHFDESDCDLFSYGDWNESDREIGDDEEEEEDYEEDYEEEGVLPDN